MSGNPNPIRYTPRDAYNETVAPRGRALDDTWHRLRSMGANDGVLVTATTSESRSPAFSPSSTLRSDTTSASSTRTRSTCLSTSAPSRPAPFVVVCLLRTPQGSSRRRRSASSTSLSANTPSRFVTNEIPRGSKGSLGVPWSWTGMQSANGLDTGFRIKWQTASAFEGFLVIEAGQGKKATGRWRGFPRIKKRKRRFHAFSYGITGHKSVFRYGSRCYEDI